MAFRLRPPGTVRLLAPALLGSAVLFAPPASAHTALTASDPPAGAALTAGPVRVTATFNEDVRPEFAAMTVVGPDGDLWSAGRPEVVGSVVGTSVRPLGPAGAYTVNYRVTAADGHPVTGSWSFTVAATGGGSPGLPPVGPSAQSPAGSPVDRVPLWPFLVGVGAAVVGGAVWGLRRRG